MKVAVSIVFFICLSLQAGVAAAQPSAGEAASTEPVWGTVRSVLPAYPAELRTAGVSGDVKLKIKTNKEGKVTDAEFSSGQEKLKELSVRAARQWQFVPILKDGKVSGTNGTVIFTFAVDGSVQASYFLSLFQGQENDPIPQAILPVTEAEREWWERVQKAGRDLKQVGKEFREEYRNKKLRTSFTDQEAEDLRTSVFKKYQTAFRESEERLRSLYEEMKQKAYRVPLPSHLPLTLHLESASHTNSAREKRVKGIVVLEVRVLPDGSSQVVKVVRGLPEGLTEQSILAVQRMIFFPASSNGKLIDREITIEFSFDVF